jgi:hypothetical protein
MSLKSEATRAAELRRLYRRWMLELWNGDLAVAAELVTDDFVIHQARAGGAGSEEQRGPEAVVEMVRDGHAPFDELTFEIEVGPSRATWWPSAGRAGAATGAACPGQPRPPAPRSASAASTCSGPGATGSPSTGSAPTAWR